MTFNQSLREAATSVRSSAAPAVQLPNLSVPPPMFPVPPPKRTLLPPPQYLATVPPPTLAPLNVPPPTATLHVRPHLLTHGRPFVANADYVKPNNNRVTCNTVVPLQVLRLPPPPPPDEPEPPAPPVTRARMAAAQRPPPTLTPIQRAAPTAQRAAPTTAELPQEPTQATEPSVDTAGGKDISVMTTGAAPEINKASSGDTKPTATVANAATIEPPSESVKSEIQGADMKVATAADVTLECAAQPVTESVAETVAVKPLEPTTQAEACASQSHEPQNVAVPEDIAPISPDSSPAISSAATALESAAEPVTDPSNEAVAAKASEPTTQGEALQSHEPHNATLPESIAPIASGSSPSMSSTAIALERAAQTVSESVTKAVAVKASNQPYKPEDFSPSENVTANFSVNDKANTVEDVSKAENGAENVVQSSGILGGETSIAVDQNVEGDSCSSGATEIEEDISGRMEVNYGDSEEPFIGEDKTFHEETGMLATERGELDMVTEGLTAADMLEKDIS
ncbi:mucin-2-like, partial [Rhipicephalus sanguineus]|uniref:mucin-2-like n=1 Tax=Rhipicephalus sanguineus TaxID=34632 RepID=UPI001895190E